MDFGRKSLDLMHNFSSLEKKIHKLSTFRHLLYLQEEKYCNYSLGIVHATGLYPACMNNY